AGSAATLGAVGLAAWTVRSELIGDHVGFWASVLDVALTTVAVAAAEVLTFGLVPLTFLDGAAILRWSRPAWLALAFAGAFSFLHVVLQPTGGTTGARVAYLAWLLGIYLIAAFAFWGWFRLHPSPEVLASGPAPEGDSPDLETAAGQGRPVGPSG